MSNHVVIVGWNERGPAVAGELDDEGEAYMVLGLQGTIDHHQTLERRWYVQATDLAEGLNGTHCDKARALIVLAGAVAAAGAGDEVDLWVCKTILAIRRWEAAQRRSGSPRLYVVAEVIRTSNCAVAKDCGADEIICVGSFGVTLLAQAATKPRLSRGFESLLKTSDDTNEIYFDPGPSTAKPFEACVVRTDARGRRLAIGVMREENGVPKILINPKADFLVSPRDKLIVVAGDAWRGGVSLDDAKAAPVPRLDLGPGPDPPAPTMSTRS
jgi:hypothetical protein